MRQRVQSVIDRYRGVLFYAQFVPAVVLAVLAWWLDSPSLLMGALVPGVGIAPPAGAMSNEMTAITRRAFVPNLVVNFGKATPTVGAMLSNAKSASGGYSSITIPVQLSALTTAQTSDFSGGFNAPQTLNGIAAAEGNLKIYVVPIGYNSIEGLLQMDAAIVSRIQAVMNDSGNQLGQTISTALFTNATNGTANIDGFQLMAAMTGTYLNIDRSANTAWRGFTQSVGPAAIPTREQLLTCIMRATFAAGGARPTHGIMAPGTWTYAAQQFLPLEQFNMSPGGRSFADVASGPESAFSAFMIAGVPIYVDFDAVEGTMLLFNARYTCFYMHEAAAFTFTGFASSLPNSALGYVGCVVLVMEAVSAKPSTTAYFTGFATISML